MRLDEYAIALRRYWRAGLALIALALTIAVLAVLLTPREYVARARIMTSSNAVGNGAQLATSDAVVSGAMRRAGVTIPMADVKRRLTARVAPGTSVVEVVYQDPDPQRGRNFVNAVAAELLDTLNRLSPSPGMTVAEARGDGDQVSLTFARALPLALVLGAFLAFVQAIIRYGLRQAPPVAAGERVK